jgi:Domain of unknown function (DUF397)
LLRLGRRSRRLIAANAEAILPVVAAWLSLRSVERRGVAVADTDGSAGPLWKKSSWSAANGHCVEVAQLPGSSVGVRNSRDNAPSRPVLVFSQKDWDSFVMGINANDFDLP